MANERKQKKKSGGWWWLVFVAIGLISQAAENGNFRRFWMRMGNGSFRRLWLQFRLFLLRNRITVEPAWLLAAAGLVIVLVIVSVSRAAAKRRAEVMDRRPAAARTSAAVQRKDPRTRSFERPEPYCLVCDHTGEDHFQHDKAQRIRQLDEWVKNGLIDREEYKVLKSRFERDL